MQLIKTNSFRHILYEQKGGYLLIPIFIMLVLSTVAATLPHLEEEIPAFSRWALHTSWLVPSDPGMAQLLLAAIAGSCITIVSVVYSILLIALTFASIQFSPRILTSFVKDRVSQMTLGIYSGTFAYCLILLPNVHGGAKVVLPKLSLTCALLLATVCLFYLIYFIHHISTAIQANYLVDRIAKEAKNTLQQVFGESLQGFPLIEEPITEPDSGIKVKSTRSGYIQYIDESKLLKLAIQADATIYFDRTIGQFIPALAPCLTITSNIKISTEFQQECISCFHIGPLRSMEQDVEFGVLQMVDIALKAISPAVNDPSTAICCIDHLSSVVLLAATLQPPICRVFDPNGIARLVRRRTSFPRLLEVAYNQIIPYSKSDMAVSLRVMRAFQDISEATIYPPYLAAICKQAQRVCKACTAFFSEDDCQELFGRLTVIEARNRTFAK